MDFGFTFPLSFSSFSSKKLLKANYSSCTICTMNFISKTNIEDKQISFAVKVKQITRFYWCTKFPSIELSENGRERESEKRHQLHFVYDCMRSISILYSQHKCAESLSPANWVVLQIHQMLNVIGNASYYTLAHWRIKWHLLLWLRSIHIIYESGCFFFLHFSHRSIHFKMRLFHSDFCTVRSVEILYSSHTYVCVCVRILFI